jgi:AhpD family alkylhydroperoxidase
VYAALSGVSKAVAAAGMDSADRAVKLRVSQINGCAFCLQFHLNIARKLDRSAQVRPAGRLARRRHLHRAKLPRWAGPRR